jgi:anaerobic selenocysteine-containing dehydrogenase
MVWVTAGNPVAMLPDARRVEHALASREMTVVVDSFLTDTARAARVVLPTTTLLEDDDLVGAYGHHWIGEVRPVVAAPEGVRTDYEILVALAARLGLSETFSGSVESWKRRLLAPVAERGASLEALRAGPVRNPAAPPVLFADRRFKTPSGRVNLIHEVDPEPARPTRERPLLFMAFSTEKAQSSQWAHPKLQRGPATATVHPDAAPGLADGDLARIESEIGELEVRLRFDDRQRRDVVLMPKGGWLRDGRCANAIIPAAATDAGGGAVYYDTPVRILAR